jgi:hypothetical protein
MGLLINNPEKSCIPNKEVVMENTAIKAYAREAYTLYKTPSDLSITEKSALFAGFFAYEVAKASCSKNGDIAGCLAAYCFFQTMAANYDYAFNREQAGERLQQAQSEYEKTRGLNPDTFQNMPFKWYAPSYHSHSFETPHIDLADKAAFDALKSAYIKAYCTAFLVFEAAEKTSTQEAFEAVIEEKLNEAYVEPYGYDEIFFQFLMRTEVALLMAFVLLLGLTILALPSLGFSTLSASATYTIGGGMTALGGTFHAWRFFSNTQTLDDPPGNTFFNAQAI